MNKEVKLSTVTKSNESCLYRIYYFLDKVLLFILAVEQLYLILVILLGVVFSIITFIQSFSTPYYSYWMSIVILFLIFILSLPINVILGVLGTILIFVINKKDYPGTGHLLNWIFVLITSWYLIFFFIVLFPSIAGDLVHAF
jgi:hypothetical protein